MIPEDQKKYDYTMKLKMGFDIFILRWIVLQNTVKILIHAEEERLLFLLSIYSCVQQIQFNISQIKYDLPSSQNSEWYIDIYVRFSFLLH